MPNKVWVPNKTEDLNLCFFNKITGINESKTLARHVSWERKCKFDGRKCNSYQKWNNNNCRCECKKHICEKDYISNPATCSCKNGKYLASIIDYDSLIRCDEAKEAEARSYDEETKTVPTNLMEKLVKHKILLTFLLITIVLLIAISIRIYDGTRCLVLFGNEKYDFIYNRVRYIISVKSGITYIISHNYAKMKVDSYDSSPLEKAVTFHNAIILLKSVWNTDKNNYY